MDTIKFNTLEEVTLHTVKSMVKNHYDTIYSTDLTDEEFRFILFNFVEDLMDVVNPEIKRPNRRLKYLGD